MSDIQPASPSALDAEVSQVACDLIVASQAAKGWEERKSSLKTRLTELWTVGVAPTEFTAKGYKFALRDGRDGFDVDDEGKEQLKTFMQKLVADGHATPKVSASFWDTRKAPKPKARKNTRNPASAADVLDKGILERGE